jgi:hypothetical protein
MQNQYIQNAALLIVKADGSYSYRSALNGTYSCLRVMGYRGMEEIT